MVGDLKDIRNRTPHYLISETEPVRNNPNLARWPEGLRQAELFAFSFYRPLAYSDLSTITNSFPTEYRDLKQAMLPHLLGIATDRILEQLLSCEVDLLAAANQNSVWPNNLVGEYFYSIMYSANIEGWRLFPRKTKNIFLRRDMYFLFYRDL